MEHTTVGKGGTRIYDRVKRSLDKVKCKTCRRLGETINRAREREGSVAR